MSCIFCKDVSIGELEEHGGCRCCGYMYDSKFDKEVTRHMSANQVTVLYILIAIVPVLLSLCLFQHE